MSRTEKIPSLDAARQARADDVRNALATVALRARTLATPDETWENAAEVLDALTLALGEGDSGTLQKMAELARKAERVRNEAFGTEHRRALVTDFQQWDGVSPTAAAMAERLLERGGQNLALKLGARGKPGESYLREDVARRVAKALEATFQRVRKDWIPGAPLPKQQGKNLVAAGLRALGVDEKKASSALDQRARRQAKTTADR